MTIDPNWIAKAIAPKSTQLNTEDLLPGPITVTITDVKLGSDEQPIAIVIDGGWKPYMPCKTMLRVIVFCWTKQAAKWIGKRLTLYADPSVKWAGVAVGGIRISHVSGIDKEVTLMLAESKKSRKAYSVKPLHDVAPPQTNPDIPPAIAAVLNEWRPKLTSENKALVAMAKRIAAVRTPEQSREIEDDLTDIFDRDVKVLLTDFLKAIRAALA